MSGFLGQRLLALLDAAPEVARVVGLDVREPPRRARKLAFHRVDVVNADLAPFLRGVDTVVHLAAIVEPVPDDALVTRVNRDGTRRVLEHAGASGVRKFVRPSSAAVYGAWANNPVPLREDAPLRPNPGFLPAICDAESERLVAAWRAAQEGRVATRLRIAPVLGEGAPSLFASYFSGRTPLAVRHAAPPVQVVHLDDAASALAHAVVHDLDGVYNVAADGWIAHDDWLALLPRRRVPGIPHEVALRLLQALWASGLADVPPAALPYLTQPWVVANDRLTDTGWAPRHTNEEAVVLASVPANAGALPWVAAVGAVVAGAAGATWWLRHRRR